MSEVLLAKEEEKMLRSQFDCVLRRLEKVASLTCSSERLRAKRLNTESRLRLQRGKIFFLPLPPGRAVCPLRMLEGAASVAAEEGGLAFVPDTSKMKHAEGSVGSIETQCAKIAFEKTLNLSALRNC